MCPRQVWRGDERNVPTTVGLEANTQATSALNTPLNII